MESLKSVWLETQGQYCVYVVVVDCGKGISNRYAPKKGAFHHCWLSIPIHHYPHQPTKQRRIIKEFLYVSKGIQAIYCVFFVSRGSSTPHHDTAASQKKRHDDDTLHVCFYMSLFFSSSSIIKCGVHEWMFVWVIRRVSYAWLQSSFNGVEMPFEI